MANPSPFLFEIAVYDNRTVSSYVHLLVFLLYYYTTSMRVTDALDFVR